jgi:hypothetical protein
LPELGRPNSGKPYCKQQNRKTNAAYREMPKHAVAHDHNDCCHHQDESQLKPKIVLKRDEPIRSAFLADLSLTILDPAALFCLRNVLDCAIFGFLQLSHHRLDPFSEGHRAKRLKLVQQVILSDHILKAVFIYSSIFLSDICFEVGWPTQEYARRRFPWLPV